VLNLRSRLLYLRKEARFPLKSRLGGPQSMAGRFGEDKNPPGFERRIVQTAA